MDNSEPRLAQLRAEHEQPATEVAAINARYIEQRGATLHDVAGGTADPFEVLSRADIRMMARTFLEVVRTGTDLQPQPTLVSPVAARVQQPTSDFDWDVWNGNDNGAMPDGMDKDDAIAYRMKDGSVLCTDYPYDLNWIHEGEPADIVAYRLLTADEVKDMLPWIEWAGTASECPVDPAAMIQVRLFNYGHNEAINAGLQNWAHHAINGKR